MSTHRPSLGASDLLFEQPIQQANDSSSNHYNVQVLKTATPVFVLEILSFFAAIYGGDFLATSLLQAWTSISTTYALLLIGCIVLMYAAIGLYPAIGINPIFEFRQCVLGVVAGTILTSGILTVTSNSLNLLVSFPFALLAASVTRPILRQLFSKSDWWGMKCLVFGCDQRADTLYTSHVRDAANGLRPVGFVQSKVLERLNQETRACWLGDYHQASQLMKLHSAYVAILHRRGRSDDELAEFVEKYLSDFPRVLIVSDDNRLPSLWSTGMYSGILIKDRLLSPYAQVIKRSMDIVVSTLGLLALMPFLLIVAVVMKLTSPGPLFFGHERIGYRGKRFKVWKFRSMHVNANKLLSKTLERNPELKAEWDANHKLRKDPRVSWIGGMLRTTSLDELPQLWNVLKGEMSLVGPRPIVTDEIKKYEDKYNSYLRVVPGVTGYWQISGRNQTTYERRVQLDQFYVKNWSVWFDVYILVRTVKTVLMREGAY